jgi:hypothetical protein
VNEPREGALDSRSYNGAKFPNAGEVSTDLSPQEAEVHAEDDLNVVMVDFDPAHQVACPDSVIRVCW